MQLQQLLLCVLIMSFKVPNVLLMMKIKYKTVWRWWAKALGEKSSSCNNESDRIAYIRTFIFLTYLITNCFIVAGVIRHWDDTVPVIEVHTDTPVRVQQPL